MTNEAQGEQWPDNMALEEQISILAEFIVETYPGEPSQSGGAIETAIRLMNADHRKAAQAEALVQALSNRAGYCWHCCNFTGEDKVQGGSGDDLHEDWCQIGAAIANYRKEVPE
jgi:hypothetical protein